MRLLSTGLSFFLFVSLAVGLAACISVRGWLSASTVVVGQTVTVSMGLFSVDGELNGQILTSGRYCPSADDNTNAICDANNACVRSCVNYRVARTFAILSVLSAALCIATVGAVWLKCSLPFSLTSSSRPTTWALVATLTAWVITIGSFIHANQVRRCIFSLCSIKHQFLHC